MNVQYKIYIRLVALFEVMAGGMYLYLVGLTSSRAAATASIELFNVWMVAGNVLYVVAGIGLLFTKRWAWWASVLLNCYTIIERTVFIALSEHGGILSGMAATFVPSYIFAIACLLALFHDDVQSAFGITLFARKSADVAAGVPVRRNKRRIYIVIICLLLLLGLYAVGKGGYMIYSALDSLKAGAAHGDISAINSALNLYHEDVKTHQYPALLQQLISDNAAGWSGPYMATITNDPWNNAYQYLSTGDSYAIMSVHDRFGADTRETVRYTVGDTEVSFLP